MYRTQFVFRLRSSVNSANNFLAQYLSSAQISTLNAVEITPENFFCKFGQNRKNIFLRTNSSSVKVFGLRNFHVSSVFGKFKKKKKKTLRHIFESFFVLGNPVIDVPGPAFAESISEGDIKWLKSKKIKIFSMGYFFNFNF